MSSWWFPDEEEEEEEEDEDVDMDVGDGSTPSKKKKKKKKRMGKRKVRGALSNKPQDFQVCWVFFHETGGGPKS